MREIHVSVYIPAPVALVFAAISDHENFFSGPGISCRLSRVGALERNGLGAIREVQVRGLLFVEQITAFRPPHGFEYRVLRMSGARGRRKPFVHERGWLEFVSENDGTRIEWHSRFSIPLPLIGRLLEPHYARKASHLFEKLLHATRERLLAGRAATMSIARP